MHRLQSSAGGDGECLPGSLVEGLCNILLIGAIISVKMWLTARQEFSPPLPQLTHPPSLPRTSLPCSHAACKWQKLKHPNSHNQAPKFPSSPGDEQGALPKSTILLGSFPSIQNPAPRGSACDAPAHLGTMAAPGAAAPRGACRGCPPVCPPCTRLRSPPLIQARSRGGEKNERILNF